MSETNHPWCSSPARDEAIRAAEDAAAAERTPPPDHRDLPQAVKELRERVGRLEAFTTSCICRETEVAVCTVNPAADAAGSEGDGLRDVRDSRTATDGLRTERVTLEITFRRGVKQVSASSWDWFQIVHDGHGLQDLEYVRVVEEATIGSGDVFADVGCGTTGDEIVRITAERDAALRHIAATEQSRRDAIRERDAARARVAELEAAAAPAANAGGEANNPAAPDSSPQPPRGWLTDEERDAVDHAADIIEYMKDAEDDDGSSFEAKAGTLRGLLARETPPQVKVPVVKLGGFPKDRDDAWIAAIREAGWEVG